MPLCHDWHTNKFILNCFEDILYGYVASLDAEVRSYTRQVIGSINTRGNIFNTFILISSFWLQGLAPNCHSRVNHTMLPEFGSKWGTEVS